MAEKDKKPDIEKISLRMESKWSEAENRIIQDIVRRIRTYGEITSTADYQINRLVAMGRSSEEIEKILKETLQMTYPEMYKLYDDVINWEYVRNKSIYEQINREFIPPEENEWLQQVSEAVKKQTADELSNIAQSYGFTVMEGGKKVFMLYAQYYQQYVDAALMDILSGGFDYNTVMRRVVTQMTNSGVRTVPYASGYTSRVPVAVRRAVLTGLAQTTGKISEYNAKKLGTDYFEVDWHAGARPEHRIWQGKVYSSKQLRTVCGLGTVTGLHGANCYHDYYPFFPGISERSWTDGWLEVENLKEAQTRTWNGKELDTYGVTQEQRKMETAMRAQRSKIAALKTAGVDQEEIILEQAKYQGQLYEYTKFCNRMGVVQQRERIYMDGLGRLAPRAVIKKNVAAKAKKVYTKGINIDDKQFGKKIGKHAKDFGLKPGDKDNREKVKSIVNDIVNNYDEIVPGKWRGQGELLPNGGHAGGIVDFIIKGNDVVVAKNGNFITILKDGVNNARVKEARGKSKI